MAGPTSVAASGSMSDFVSANPTGPMHMGHCRGAVVGDALASLLEHVGYRVTREYYVNDAGGQVDILARSVWLRYREALGEDIGAIPEGLYPGDYLKPVGEQLAAEFGDRFVSEPESEWLVPFRQQAVSAMMEMIRRRSRHPRHPSRRLRLGGRRPGGGQAGSGGGAFARTRPHLRRRVCSGRRASTSRTNGSRSSSLCSGRPAFGDDHGPGASRSAARQPATYFRLPTWPTPVARWRAAADELDRRTGAPTMPAPSSGSGRRSRR